MREGNYFPAFPVVKTADSEWKEGMSLRDWFAGQALNGLASWGASDYQQLVRHAYDIADAMMKERDK